MLSGSWPALFKLFCGPPAADSSNELGPVGVSAALFRLSRIQGIDTQALPSMAAKASNRRVESLEGGFAASSQYVFSYIEVDWLGVLTSNSGAKRSTASAAHRLRSNEKLSDARLLIAERELLFGAVQTTSAPPSRSSQHCVVIEQ